MRHFVKPHFSGWHEVDKEHFDSFVANIREGATAMSEAQKEECIKARTRIEKGGETNVR